MSATLRAWAEKHEGEEYTELFVSLGFIVATLLAAEFTRLCIKWILKDPQGLTRVLLMELVASTELCAACYEVCVIADRYGIWWYALVLYICGLWWTFFWAEATACPYTHLENYLESSTSLRRIILIIFIEVLGGISVYKLYVKKFWLYKFVPIHAKRIYQNKCPADLTLPSYQGAVVEGLSTLVCQLTGRVMSKFNSLMSNIVVNFVNVMLVVAAFELSGGYFNPVLATSLQYNCGEVTRGEHFICYWVGPFVGSILSVLLWHHRQVYNYLIYGPPKPKQE